MRKAVWLALSLAEMVLGSGFLRSFRSSFQDGCKFVKGSAVTKEVGAHSRPFALNKSSLADANFHALVSFTGGVA